MQFKQLAAGSAMLFSFFTIHAQQSADKAAVAKTDSIIKAQIIDPAVNSATAQNAAPAWYVLNMSVVSKYDETYADRTVTKAKIYYYYGKDDALFSTALVHYTQAYEDKENGKLMNKNANYILDKSVNPAELKIALGWVKHVADKSRRIKNTRKRWES